MRRLAGCILSILLVAGLCMPTAAQTQTTYRRGAVTCRVISNQANQIVVLVPHSDKQGEQGSSMAGVVRTIPVTGETVFLDRGGEALEQHTVLPGQRVRVTYRYTYEENSYGDDPAIAPVHCYQVQLREEIIPVRTAVQPQDLEPMTGIGVILSVRESGRYDGCVAEAHVYLDGSHNNTGDGRYQWHTGSRQVKLREGVAVRDEKGAAISWRDLQPGQRVLIGGRIETMPDAGPMWSTVDSVKLLDSGEMVIPPEAVSGQRFVRCTVLENRDRTELLVKADPHSLIGGIASVWSIPLLFADYVPENPKQFPAYVPGDELIVPFESASTATSPGTLRCIPRRIEPADGR